MTTNTLIVAFVLVLLLAGLWCIRAERFKLVSYVVLVLFLVAIAWLILGLGGIRSYVVLMQAEGVSAEQVSAVVAYSRAMAPTRTVVGLAIAALFVCGFYVARRKAKISPGGA